MTEVDEVELPTMREAGIKQATTDILADAGKAYKSAALCRASMNPEIQALAPLYEQIAETWELHALRVMGTSPPLEWPATPSSQPQEGK